MKTSTLLVVAALAASPSLARAQALVQVTDFGSNPGGLRMWKYVPAGIPQNAPLVLALHACGQQAADYVKAGWNPLADKYKFYVVYPEQTTTNNALTCFNWAGNNTNPLTGENDPANLTRGMGENMSMKQMVDKMKADYSVDGTRVFLSGLSGGAAQTALMLATWPDVFAAGATFAGIPYYCTTNKNMVTTCLNPGITHTPKEWGDLVRNDFSSYTGPWPRIAIWQGTKDSVVNPNNQTELMKQWTDVQGIPQTPTSSDTVGPGVARDIYAKNGVPVVEVLKVANMDHGVPVDPKNGCGTAAQYFNDVGVCGAAVVAADWGLTGPATTGDGGVGDGGGAGGGGTGGGAGGGGGGTGGTGGWGGGGNWVTPGAGDMGAPKSACGGCSAVGADAVAGALPIAFVLLWLLARRRRLGVVVALALSMMGTRAFAAGQFVADSFGGRAYKLYVPSSYTGAPLPLVLMLHGCTQDPDQFATGTNMNAVAEAHGFFALYPDEPSSAQALKCWQWFDPAHQTRGAGEPAALVALVDHVAAQYAVDGARTFAAGLSAGAAMSVVLGATYPDRFSAIVVSAGLEYAAATSLAGASTAQLDGGPNPAQQVRVLVFQGTADGIVAPVNGDQVAAQWRDTDAMLGAAVPATPDATEMAQVAGGRSYTTTHWGSWVQKIAVDGMGHAWSGGDAAASYTDATGPNASELSWQFFSTGTVSGGGGGGGGGGGSGNPSTTPPGMMRGGCSLGVAEAPSAVGCLIALGLLAARKRATPSAWTPSSGSASCSPRRA